MTTWSLRLQKPRRITALAHFVSLGLTVFLINLPIKTEPVGLALLFCGATYLFTGACLATVAKPYGLSRSRWTLLPKVDERQKHVSVEALAYSYWITAFSMLISYLWIQAAAIWGALWRPQTVGEWSGILWISVMVNSMLPAAIVAWNEPDMMDEPSFTVAQT